MTAVADVLAHAPRLFAWVLSHRTRRNREREVYLRLITPGMTVFDVGANVGEYTRLFSILVGSHGTVHAFEPIRPTLDRLSQRVAGRRNVRLHAVALGGQAGTKEMVVVDGDFGQASLAPGRAEALEGRRRETFQVPVVTLDELLGSGDITPPDLIKMDVEGAERSVLSGAQALIAAHKPILFFEVFDAWTRRFGHSPLDVLREVEALGYADCYLLDARLHRLPPADGLPAWPYESTGHILALPPTPSGAAARRRIAPLLAESPA